MYGGPFDQSGIKAALERVIGALPQHVLRATRADRRQWRELRKWGLV